MNVSEEKRAAFNEQMNEWVSRQGLWFQLRHAADGQTIAARLLRILIRLSLVLVLLSVVVWIYLVKRVEGDDFNTKLTASITETLKVENCEVGQIRKSRDTITIASVDADGGDESFFHKVSARVVRLNMTIADGIIGKWSAGTINISQMDLEVKAGESDDASAAKSFDALFEKYQTFEFERIAVDKANIEWGYSMTNRGSISNSTMSIVREGDAWNIEVRGGTFSQNWLRDLEIEKMTVVCDKQGVQIKEAILHEGVGTITFKSEIGSGAQPEVRGEMSMVSMPIKKLLPVRYAEWLEGTISGKGKISGSTNSQEGVVLDIDFSMGDGDVLVLRDRLPLLSALSVVDLYNSYRKVPFNEGGFHIRTGGDLLKISQIDLRAGNLLQLKGGGVVVRAPTHEEIAKALNIKDLDVVTKVMENKWKFEDDELINADRNDGGVSAAAKGVGSVVQGRNEKESSAEKVLRTSILNESGVRRFDGLVNIGLKRDAFDKAEKLKSAFPVDEESGRIWVRVPLSGRLQTLTLDQAQKFYILGKNRL